MLKLAALFLLVLPLAANAQMPTHYTITNLGNFTPAAINNRGVIVGNMGYAAMWTPSAANAATGTTQSLGLLPGFNTANATGVNASGQVVGTATNNPNTASARSRGFVWTAQGGLQDIGAVSGDTFSHVSAINDAGQAVGVSFASTAAGAEADQAHGFVWSAASGIQGLTALPAPNALISEGSHANAINASGQIAGYSSALVYVSSGFGGYTIAATACQWNTPGAPQSLGLPTGPPGTPYNSRSVGINDAGIIAGNSDTNQFGTNRAFVWSPNSGTQTIGKPVGYTSRNFVNYASGINSGSQIVGYYSDLSNVNPNLAYLYSGGVTYDLTSMLDNNSGWILNSAIAINDAGQIVGRGIYGGNSTSFLLTPVASVPEPGEATILLTLLMPCALLLRRRKG